MSSDDRIVFTKGNIDTYLKALAKEYRKLGGRKLPAEIVLIGGASVLISYGFREMTTDIDALIQSASTMKEAIDYVGDMYGLPRGWLNEDFKRTASYTPKLIQHSEYYKTFYGVLTIRSVSGEYLIAMKLRAGRQYKNDLSDILGILAAHERRKRPLTMNMIDDAVTDLYGSWEEIPDDAQEFIKNAMKDGDYDRMLLEIRESEKATRTILLDFEDSYPGKTNTENVNDIISILRKKKDLENQKK